MVDSLVQAIVGMFSGRIPKELIVFIISLFPILELRGSILAAGFLKMQFLPTFIISVIGTMLPIPFVLLFIDKIFGWMKKTRARGLAEKLENKAMSKSDQIQKYGKIGLFLFVAIPLPGTGAWTGALIASLFRMKIRDSLPWIFLGVLTAGLIMSLLSFGIIKPLIS